MDLSRVLRPETGTFEVEEDASEGDMEDSPNPRISAGPLGERFLLRASPVLLLLFQDSGVSSFCPATMLSILPS